MAAMGARRTYENDFQPEDSLEDGLFDPDFIG